VFPGSVELYFVATLTEQLKEGQGTPRV